MVSSIPTTRSDLFPCTDDVSVGDAYGDLATYPGRLQKTEAIVSHFGKVGRIPHFGKVQSLNNDWLSLSLAKSYAQTAELDFLELSAGPTVGTPTCRTWSPSRRWVDPTHPWGRLMVVHSCAMMKLYTSIYWLVVWNMNGLWLSIYWEFHHPNRRTHIFQHG